MTMRISALIVSLCATCLLYITNADWIDELIEDYLGCDYEEVAPFVSSITAGTDEFDQLEREPWGPKLHPHVLIVVTAFALTMTSFALYYRVTPPEGYELLKSWIKVFINLRKSSVNQKQIQTLMSELLEKRFLYHKDDVSVKLLWKGDNLKESSIHCNVKEEPKNETVLHTKFFFKAGDGDKSEPLTPSSSETSTARRIEKIRKMLESEQEFQKSACKDARPEAGRNAYHRVCDAEDRFKKKEKEYSYETLGSEIQKEKEELESCGNPDPKLMSRIRLLENRLRLEELKNKNWIDRMSRAEGILQQLNKQVERIEEARPMGTLTETLKITSTVTNWPSSCHPRRNMHFTLVNLYPPYYTPVQYTSLSELIKKEVGLPSAGDYFQDLYHLPPTPQIPSLPSPTSLPQGASFLSKFLCR